MKTSETVFSTMKKAKSKIINSVYNRSLGFMYVVPIFKKFIFKMHTHNSGLSIYVL